jgi:hypothetical protein
MLVRTFQVLIEDESKILKRKIEGREDWKSLRGQGGKHEFPQAPLLVKHSEEI